MKVFYHKSDIRSHIAPLQSKGLSVGMVPTMGALHLGHISLVEKALKENDLVVVSIFVNPTQFDNPDDLNKYPKTLEADMELMERASDQILVFAPSANDIYDGEIKSDHYRFDGLEKVMEGEFRTGHFDGVATIVKRLLNTVLPNRAYFGEKDFQQLQIVRKLVSLENLGVDIVGCPIVREANGLAMSSRNGRLSSEGREKASFIYATLQEALPYFALHTAKETIARVQEQFTQNPDMDLEYIQIADEETLTPVLQKHPDTKYRAFVAVYVEGVRLIDNIALN